MKLDAHHHFWKYTRQEYGWIDNDILRRDFLPADLGIEITSSGIDGVISVQARQTEEETRWLLKLAEEKPFIKGVVGWVPLVSPKITELLESHAVNRKLVGVRHVLQNEPDHQLMDDGDFNRGISALLKFDLRYDLLVYARHLADVIRFVDRHPRQVFILDHIAKPDIRGRSLDPWQQHISELADRPNVYCKISGMVTEADLAAWTSADLRPYFKTVLDAFGPDRLMFGSDWPVCLLGTSYSRWVSTVADWISELSQYEQERIWSGTALAAYGLQSDHGESV